MAGRFGEGFEAILAASQSGAGWAFERLYRALASSVAGYLRLQGATDPDDLTSEVFLGAFSRIGTFTGTEDQFRSWVFTIAHRRLTDERRRRGRRPRNAALSNNAIDRPDQADVEAQVLDRLAEERVRRLCDGLAPDQRDVLLLRLVGDLTVEQVAAALGKSVGAVKALQRRGVASLRRVLEREGVPL